MDLYVAHPQEPESVCARCCLPFLRGVQVNEGFGNTMFAYKQFGSSNVIVIYASVAPSGRVTLSPARLVT